MEYAIKATDITKIYRLYDRPIDRLKEALFFKNQGLHRDFYALRDVSLEVKKGESVGIIGKNGSGKSTMLKIITGVLTQTAGTLSVSGRISALLELGAGFNMEYTGLENVYMNGTMTGYTRREMDEKLPEILKFADIGDFINQPVKSYSSGMFVRLAFALAINVDPEILIVDEALSVGDIFFQAKCFHRMDELRKKGTTILMVTHDMGSVLRYCDRTILLNEGVKVAEGAPGKMVDLYKKILSGQYDEELREGKSLEKTHIEESFADIDTHRFDFADEILSDSGAGEGNARKEDPEHVSAGTEDGAALSSMQELPTEPLMRDFMTVNPDVNEYGDQRATIYDFGLFDKDHKLTNLILKGEEFSIREKIRFNSHIDSPIFTYTFRDKKGNDLSGTNTMFENAPVRAVDPGDIYEVTFSQRMDLQGGEYLLSMSCTGYEKGELKVYHRLYDILNLTVISNKNTVGVYDMNSHVDVKLKKAAHSAKDTDFKSP